MTAEHARLDRLELRLGVQQELGAFHHLVTRLEPPGDDHPAVRLGPKRNLHRQEVAARLRQHGVIAILRAQHRAARQRQRGLRLGLHRGVGIHARAQNAAGVGEAQARGDGAGLRVQRGVEKVQAPIPIPAGVGRKLELHAVAQAHPRHLVVVQRHIDPDPIQIGDLEQAILRRDIAALANIERRHHPALGRQDGNVAHRLARGLQLLERSLGQAQQQQALFGRGQQTLAVGMTVGRAGLLARNAVFLLRAVQLGRVNLRQHLTARHRVAHGTHLEMHDPAGEARGDGGDAVLVHGHGAHGLDRLAHGTHLCGRQAHAQVLRQARVDAQPAVVGAGFGRGVDRHVIHAHVVLHRTVRMDRRIHRADPVQHPALRRRSRGVDRDIVHPHVVLHRVVGVDGGVHRVGPIQHPAACRRCCGSCCGSRGRRGVRRLGVRGAVRQPAAAPEARADAGQQQAEAESEGSQIHGCCSEGVVR